ncbi:MAG: glycosyltransferase family A protein [candidate division FCPU426 bacterium]
MNKTMPLVSVIIPCYNDGLYLDEAVASVLNQTYPRMEIIVVDDGSTDRATCRLLKQYQRPHTTVFRIVHGGPARARNAGIARARGEYILPLDADDKIAPAYVKKAVEVMERDKGVGIVYCRARLFGAREEEWILPDYSFEKMLFDNVIFNSALYRKKSWKRAGGYNANMTDGMEDYDFWLSLLEQDERQVVRINRIMFYCRVRKESRTTRMLRDGKEAEMFTRIFFNHPRLFGRKENMLRFFQNRVAMARQNNHLHRLIGKSPALKVEKRLVQVPWLHALYHGLFGGLVRSVRGWRRFRRGLGK